MKSAIAAALGIGMLAGCATGGKGMHVEVNGLRLYCELHGPEGGVPLVLLHGGGSDIDVTYRRVLPFFAERRRVVAVDEQGHGLSDSREGPSSFEASADDVATALDWLKIPIADVMGFSNGASVALQVALRHPSRVRKLVFASSMTRRDGAPPQFWDFIRQADFSMMPQYLKDAFLKKNPDPASLRRMHDQDLERMRSFKDVPDEALRGLRAETLILIGDRDVVRLEHAVELSRLIPKSRLIVLASNHGGYLGEAAGPPGRSEVAGRTAGLIEAFLDGP